MKFGSHLFLIFNMPNHIFAQNNDQPQEMFFCLSGLEDFIDNEGNPRIIDKNSTNVVAKCVQNKKSKSIVNNKPNYTFYIKSTPNLDLFNPVLKLSPIKDKRQTSFIDGTCKDTWKFVEVSKITFDKYLKFLITKNTAWLKEANRDLK